MSCAPFSQNQPFDKQKAPPGEGRGFGLSGPASGRGSAEGGAEFGAFLLHLDVEQFLAADADRSVADQVMQFSGGLLDENRFTVAGLLHRCRIVEDRGGLGGFGGLGVGGCFFNESNLLSPSATFASN